MGLGLVSMTFTSDERREVAERLRAAAKTKSNSADYLWKRLEIAVNGWKFGDYIDESYVFDNDVLSRLADLIDPTCGEWRDYPHPVDPAGFIEDDSELWCEHCDIPLDPDYRYCPYCGSRVVSGLDAHVDGC